MHNTVNTPPASDSRSKTKAWTLIRIVISFVFLIAVLDRIEVEYILKLAWSANIGWLLFALIVAFAGRLFAAYRWFLLLRDQNPAATYIRVLKLVFISSLLGIFTPGGIGVEGFRIYGMSKTTADSALAVASVLVERLLAILVLTLLTIVGLWLAPIALPSQVSFAVWIWFLMFLIMVLIMMHPFIRAVIDKLLKGGVLNSLRTLLQNFYRSMDTYRGQPKLLAISFLAAIVAMLFRIIPTIIIARALNLHIPLTYFMIFLPIIHFLVQIPISLGGLGVRETSFIYFFSLVGVQDEMAFMMSIVVYALVLFTALPGAWFYAREGLSSKNAKIANV